MFLSLSRRATAFAVGAQPSENMEENQTSLQENQQEPENELAQSAAEAAAHVAEPVTEDEKPVEPENVEVDDENAESADAENETEQDAFEGKTPDELKALTNEELLAYLKEVAQVTPVRKVRSAVDNIRAEVAVRFPMPTAPEAASEPQPDTTQESEAAPAAPQQEPTAEEKALRDMLAQYDAAVDAEKKEARKRWRRTPMPRARSSSR